MAENRQLRNSLLLALTAAIWGVAFVAQSEGSQYMGSCTFTGLRFLIAAAALLPVIWMTDRHPDRHAGLDPASRASRGLWKAGIICGVLLCIASLVQQEGIAQGTGAGKAGFITATYIVLVPILNWVVFHRRTGWVLWLGVAIGLVGY